MPAALEPDVHDDLEDRFDFLVYEAEASPSSWTRRAFRQADQQRLDAAGGTTAATIGTVEIPGLSFATSFNVVPGTVGEVSIPSNGD